MEVQEDTILRQLVEDLGIPLKKLSDPLGMTSTQVMQWWSGRSRKVKFNDLKSFCDYFGFDADDLLNQNIDKALLKKECFQAALLYRRSMRPMPIVTSAHLLIF